MLFTVAPEVSPFAIAQIEVRERQPVVLKVDGRFPRWQDVAAASEIEVWKSEAGVWSIIPFQVDEVSADPEDVKPPVLPGAAGLYCVGTGVGPEPPVSVGPCEFEYDLRGTGQPSGILSANDELVFLAGDTGVCDAPTTVWPDAGLVHFRYELRVSDPSSGEEGCVYVFRRTSGNRPYLPDLIGYDTTGDGVPTTCLPSSDACGAVIGHEYDLDGTAGADLPSYRADFRGMWTMDKLQIGETTLDPGEDMIDIWKWRIESPSETEYIWDLYESNSKCGNFLGFIDGPVRVVRVIQGAASGQLTRKYEFAYPGEFESLTYVRIHRVGGPIYDYADLKKANVSPIGDPAIVYKGDGTSSELFDDDVGMSGKSSSSTFEPGEWYQVSSTIGSFVVYPTESKLPDSVHEDGNYYDAPAQQWNQGPLAPERDAETGDRGAAFVERGPFPDTQSFNVCVDPRDKRDLVGILGYRVVMLATDFASDLAGYDEYRRRQETFGLCSDEQEFSVTPLPRPLPGGVCVPSLSVHYADDAKSVGLEDSGCGGTLGWNLYQSLGGGNHRLIASLPSGVAYDDRNLELQEQRTYHAAAYGARCVEGDMSSAESVTFVDTTAPDPPANLSISAVGDLVTASWEQPNEFDVIGYKLLVATTSGGPYSQVHTGLLSPIVLEKDFVVAEGSTYYVVVKAIDHASNESQPSNEAEVIVP